MTSVVLKISVLLIVLAGLSCKESASANLQPALPAVQLVAKAADSAAVERGIDAEEPPPGQELPERNAIFLHWHPIVNENLASYDVYREQGDSLGDFDLIARITRQISAPDTFYYDLTASLDTTYYYYVIARNEDDIDSEPSRIEYYTLLPKPTELLVPVDNETFSGVFEWNFSANFVPFPFLMRIERQVGAQDVFAPYTVRALSTTQNVLPNQRWTLAQTGIGTIPTGRYRWRIEVVEDGELRSGAESAWAFFVMN